MKTFLFIFAIAAFALAEFYPIPTPEPTASQDWAHQLERLK